MTLNERDYREIAEHITEGHNDIVFEKDEETLFLSCDFSVDGYVEDDYLNGTGGYVETSRTLNIESARAYDENGAEKPCEVDEEILGRLVA